MVPTFGGAKIPEILHKPFFLCSILPPATKGGAKIQEILHKPFLLCSILPPATIYAFYVTLLAKIIEYGKKTAKRRPR